MRTLVFMAVAALLICTGVSCNESSHEPGRDQIVGGVVYYNSFESDGDTLGWEGITRDMFVDEPAPGGGDQSLHIGGGCIQPTAHIVLPPDAPEGSYTLSFWGKLDDSVQRGLLILAIDGDYEQREETALVVDSDRWAFYRSEQPLYVPANERVRLEIMIGGIVAASMHVDCIKIEASR